MNRQAAKLTKTKGLVLLLLFAALTVSPVYSQTPFPPALSPPNYDFSPLTWTIEQWMVDLPLDGAALILVQHDTVIYENGFGRFSTDSDVPIASGSKWLSAALVLTLVDDGEIFLDTPISYILPAFTGESGTITMRQLLSHTSGLPLADCIRNAAITLAECAASIAELELTAPPGTEFAYGSSGYQVAGRIAEVAGGDSWNGLFAERLAVPLDMPNTRYEAHSNPTIAGGARSTANDYVHFLQMLLNDGQYNGVQILSPEAVRSFALDQNVGVPIGYTPHPKVSTRYGLGDWLEVVDENGIGTRLSSPGSYGFTPWIDTERDLAGVFVAMDQWHRVYPMTEAIHALVNGIVDAA